MRYLLALGSNLGDRATNLERCLGLLAEAGVTVTARGEVVETPAWGGDPTKPYLNLVVEARTELRPGALLRLAKEIEQRLGRDLGAPRNAPRPIDVDLLACAGTTMSSPELTLPHPRLAGRAFLDRPLATLPTIGGWRAGLGLELS